MVVAAVAVSCGGGGSGSSFPGAPDLAKAQSDWCDTLAKIDTAAAVPSVVDTATAATDGVGDGPFEIAYDDLVRANLVDEG